MIKYAIAWVGNGGFETIERRSLFKTRAKAREDLINIITNNNHEKLASVYGDLFIKTARIVSVRCYANGTFKDREEAAHSLRVGDKVSVKTDGRKYVRYITELYHDVEEGYCVNKPCPEGKTPADHGFVSWNINDMKLIERAVGQYENFESEVA